MDIIKLYDDYGIKYATEGNAHCTEGWVQVDCPLCIGSKDFHLGYNIDEGYYHCWRCGGHSLWEVIGALLNVSEREARFIIRQYQGISAAPVKPAKIRHKSFRLPSNVMPLSNSHKGYLRNRGFDPDKIETEWGIRGTGVYSALDEIDYSWRIIIPIMWEGKIVSFDSRDITRKAKSKYKACPTDRELIPRKDILYNRPEKETAICVEGPLDVWRMGPDAFATFGIAYTSQQLTLISRLYKTVHVLFDGGREESQAQQQAKKLIAELRFRGVDAVRVPIEGDPGDMKQSEADYLAKQLVGTKKSIYL